MSYQEEDPYADYESGHHASPHFPYDALDAWKTGEEDDSETRYFRNWQEAEAWAKRTSERAKKWTAEEDAKKVIKDSDSKEAA